MFAAPAMKLSPTDSEPDGGWLLETLTGTDAQAADQMLWQCVGCNGDCDQEPIEYRTLFENKGFIFNTGRPLSCDPQRLEAVRPTSLSVSPSSEQLATLINPSSPGHRQLTAVLRAPPLTCPSLALLRCIEMDPGMAERELAAPRGTFLRAATHLHSRLLDLDNDTSCLMYEGLLLRHDFQEMLADTDELLRQARQLQQDIQDLLYLKDLIWMLRGRLERVSRRRWPFLTAHIDPRAVEEINLVV